MQIPIIYDLIKTQGEYLKTHTNQCIEGLNKMAAAIPGLIKEHDPKCIIFFNHGQATYSIHLCLLLKDSSFKHFQEELALDFNDGGAFGLEDLEYDEIEHYPTEDYFTIQRQTHLDNLFYDWLLECTWNSELIKIDFPLIYSATADCDELFDIKDGLSEYHNFDFLD